MNSSNEPPLPESGEEALAYTVKAHLRQQIGRLRKLLPEQACRTRSRAICDRVVSTPEFEGARTVVAYVALGKEANPAAILEAAARAGKTLGLVRVPSHGNLLALHLWKAGDPLEKSALGLLEPASSAPLLNPSEVDLMIVPAMAIDPRGRRIGRGGAYYDRLLAAAPNLFTFGIIYDFQLIPEAPVTAGDRPVRAVATDQRLIYVKNS